MRDEAAVSGSTGMRVLPVTPREETLVARYASGSRAGHFTVANAYLLLGPLEVRLLEQAVNDVIAEHDNLRSRFDFDEGRVRRLVAPTLRLTVGEVDLQDVGQDQGSRVGVAIELAAGWLREAPGATAFPLIRVRVITVSPNARVLYYDVHHLVFDVWSHGIFIAALFQAYTQRARGVPYTPLRKPASIAHYLEHLQTEEKRDARLRNLAFWRQELDGHQPVQLHLNGRPRSPLTTWSTGTAIACTLYAPRDNDIARLAQSLKISAYSIYLAAFAALIFQRTSSSDIVIESVVSLRIDPRHADLIGSMFGTIPFRCRFAGDVPLRDFISSIHEQYATATARRDAAFEEWDSTPVTGQGLLSPLTSFSLNYWPRPLGAARFCGIDVRPLHVPAPSNTVVRCEYNVSIMETNEGAHYRVRYHDHAYTHEEAAASLKHLAAMTLHLASRSDTTLGRLLDEFTEELADRYEADGRLLGEAAILPYMKEGIAPPAELLQRSGTAHGR